ncbi:ABC transporter ATP-binding protein [Streptosporangium sp. 'caverna']|uniref:ABC transporter ATP-binding protein n=1 Tax=Streptosporangium sp. 'caverna' TaxID=2202249 RepID=UPI000D7E975D|nr:ABC transporter ATP-binding protein [Streptosporangium sp. 'caverna']AWS48529.1 multidrug ABC transporter permease [Streptosporangium sp. 'caverna']
MPDPAGADTPDAARDREADAAQNQEADAIRDQETGTARSREADAARDRETDAAQDRAADAARAPEGARELLPVATPARTRAVVRQLLRPHRGLLLGGFVVMVGATTVGLLTQPLLGYMVDLVTEHRPVDALTLPAVFLVLVAVAQGITTALGLSLISQLGETVLAHLRERFVERALGLPLEQLEKAGSGDLTARITGDVSLVAEAVRSALPELVRSVLAIVLTLGALAVLDWRFMLAALLAVPIQAHTARWYVRRAASIYAEQRIATGVQQQQLLDTIGGASAVRAFRLEEGHTELVTRRSWSAVELTMRGVRLMLRFYSRLHLGEYIGLAAVLVVGFLLVRSGSTSIGTATAAALYFHSLFTPINSALVLIDDAQSAGASLARLVGVADQPVAEETATPVATVATVATQQPRGSAVPPAGAVAVTGLGHAYEPGRPVLHDIDLALRPGERVALVGASGAGKTTLAKLIAGIHRPTTGSVRLSVTDPQGSGRTVALVTQEVHVFAGPLADDLRLARPDATDDDLYEALTQVDALTWAEALPDGLGTVVGEGGHRLTPTQAQQLALARLILADPPIAVLDEATAEAGSTGARLLEKATDRAIEGRTALIVAHRLTQAATADRIVVMDDGRIVESGGHGELCAAGGPYAALWEAWSDTRSTAPH